MGWQWPWSRKSITSADLALELLGQAAAKSGVRVTWETALQASTAMACARVIADGIAQVPLKLHRALDRGSEEASDHPLFDVVSKSPSKWLTSFEWRETAGMHLAISNRTYAYINRMNGTRAGKTELLPLAPHQVRTERGDDFAPRYFVTFKDGGSEEEVAPEKILHLHGPSWNGWEGLDGVKLAREAIGLAMATEEHGSRMFKNGATVGGLLSTDSQLTAQQAKDLRASWDAAQAGLGNAYKTALLWGGLKWTPRAMQNDQAQWVEVRRFQVAEVCRFYRVLPIMVGEAANTSTYASAEQMFLAHAIHTMGPWYKRIEQRLDLQLLTEQERAQGYYFKFNVTSLLRGSHSERAKYYQVMYGIGALNPNEIRELEERNPYEEGDDYYVPMNMAIAGAEPEPELDAKPSSQKPKDDEGKHDMATITHIAELKAMVATMMASSNMAHKSQTGIDHDAVMREIAGLKSALSAAQQTTSVPHFGISATDLYLAVPDGQITVKNEGTPMVTVNVPEAAAPVVNIAPAEVKVSVAAPEVNVTAEMPAVTEMRIIGMPPRTTESTVERDRAGNIVKTTQTEKDA
jgi:HK97 family phage portal protein